MNLIEIFNERKIDYKDVYKSCMVLVRDFRIVDISIIIPVHGREQYNEPLTRHLLKAIKNSNVKVSITFVEHSVTPDHMDLCSTEVNYIHIPKAIGGQFNKCLCHNIGALYSNRSKWIMFHDVDTVTQSDFFEKLYSNIGEEKALQCFTKQRLLHCNEDLTVKIFAGEIDVDSLTKDSEGISEAVSGALGGSILVDGEIFFESGGFAPEFYSQYSIEDAFFWRCVHLFTKIKSCNDPEIEMFHLWHKPSFNRTTKTGDFEIFYRWGAIDTERKLELTKVRSEHLKQFQY
jgi:predicted glycosyltransferase involved in capsule biosynthesis